MGTFLLPALLLGAIGIMAAALLYWAARRFHVAEDPRIEQVENVLPGANCGGCGYSGCHAFAVACVGADNLDSFYCPGGGATTMERISLIVGMQTQQRERRVAMVHCGGSCEVRPKSVDYKGVKSCAVVSLVGAGDGGCPNGCMGYGDCERACGWGAIHINPVTRLPEVDDDKCTGCGVCVNTCPRRLIELRPPGPKGRRVWVACNNRERGAVARRSCAAACIACSMCVKACPFEAIAVNDQLARIDPTKCRLCRKCIEVCPDHTILATWTPPIPAKPSC